MPHASDIANGGNAHYRGTVLGLAAIKRVLVQAWQPVSRHELQRRLDSVVAQLLAILLLFLVFKVASAVTLVLFLCLGLPVTTRLRSTA